MTEDYSELTKAGHKLRTEAKELLDKLGLKHNLISYAFIAEQHCPSDFGQAALVCMHEGLNTSFMQDLGKYLANKVNAQAVLTCDNQGNVVRKIENYKAGQSDKLGQPPTKLDDALDKFMDDVVRPVQQEIDQQARAEGTPSDKQLDEMLEDEDTREAYDCLLQFFLLVNKVSALKNDKARVGILATVDKMRGQIMSGIITGQPVVNKATIDKMMKMGSESFN